MSQVQVKFGEWLEKGFNLYKENFGLLVLATLLALLLSVVSLGILIGPMTAGLFLITLGLIDKSTPKPEAGTLFKGFGFFLNTLLFLLVWGLLIFIASFILALVPCIGTIASMLLGYAMQALLMFSFLFIVDRKMDFWPASMESINLVKTNFWPFLGFGIVCAIISSLGAIACGIGVIFTAPFGYCAVTVAYREITSGPQAVAAPGGDFVAVESEPPAPPAAGTT
jgi:uncharacterized membrane protein